MKVFTTEKGIVKAWVDGVKFEDGARTQVQRIADLPFVFKHVAVMPDVHAGKGATVGSVIATKGAVIPAAVGVDIGCGMIAGLTNLTTADIDPADVAKRDAMFHAISKRVPHGRTDNGGKNDRGSWGMIPAEVQAEWDANLNERYRALIDKHGKISHLYADNQLGTLGTGNHFLECSYDEQGRIWVVIHSGSRGAGAKIGNYFIRLAKDRMEQYFITLPDAELAYLPEDTTDAKDYLEAVGWAQDYAAANRTLMLQRALLGIQEGARVSQPYLLDTVHCHHNYIERERHFHQDVLVTRKGAIRARKSDRGIIPGSMGARSYIVQGKGNPDSFCSASHGAGRVMSRTEALNTISVEQHVKATEGVSCRKDAEVRDESPPAYKDIDAVMAAQTDLVEIVHTLKQFVCVKG